MPKAAVQPMLPETAAVHSMKRREGCALVPGGRIPAPDFRHQAAKEPADLNVRGLPMGAHDLIVASTAVRLGYAVMTRDRRSSARIEGLDVEHWQ